jgi:hypothetical protein
MLKNNSEQTTNNILFSFSRALLKCVEVKNKNFFFTNRVAAEEIKKYRTIIENVWQVYSSKTIKQLEQSRSCYLVKKEKIDETRDNIAKVFQAAKYPDQWIEQNVRDLNIYKFKITKQIRLFGIVERNIVYILLYDIWHLINK